MFDDEPLCDFAAYEYDGLTTTPLTDYLRSYSITDLLSNKLETVKEASNFFNSNCVWLTLQLNFDSINPADGLGHYPPPPGLVLSLSANALIDLSPRVTIGYQSLLETHRAAATLLPDDSMRLDHIVLIEPGDSLQSHEDPRAPLPPIEQQVKESQGLQDASHVPIDPLDSPQTRPDDADLFSAPDPVMVISTTPIEYAEYADWIPPDPEDFAQTRPHWY